MRRDAQRKLLLTQRAPRARVGRKSLPYSIERERTGKFAAYTACALRASRGKSISYSIVQMRSNYKKQGGED